MVVNGNLFGSMQPVVTVILFTATQPKKMFFALTLADERKQAVSS